MAKWFLTVELPVWFLESSGELELESVYRGVVSRGVMDLQSYDGTVRPFFQTTSSQAAQELVRLFQTEYGQPQKTEARPRFAVVAGAALSTTDRVLHAAAVSRIARDAELAHCAFFDPEYPEEIGGVLARWYDRATEWQRLLEEELGGQPADGEEAAQATAPLVKESPETAEPLVEDVDTKRPRCAPMTRTEIARRLLNRQKARPRDAEDMMNRHGLRPENGNLYTICIDELEPEIKQRLRKPAS